MKAEEQRDIIQAYIDGKAIEYTKNYGWYLVPHNAEFNFQEINYRIVKTGEERLIEVLLRLSESKFPDMFEGMTLHLIDEIKEGKFEGVQIGRTKKGYFPYLPGFTGLTRETLEELTKEIGGINEVERVKTKNNKKEVK